jgi:hypothetical protein
MTQRAEDRGQKAEDRRQRTEGSWRKDPESLYVIRYTRKIRVHPCKSVSHRSGEKSEKG